MSTAQEYVEPEVISDTKKCVAEAIGTFVLVFTAVGTAVFAGARSVISVWRWPSA